MRLTSDTLRMYCTCLGDCMLLNLGTNGAGYPQANINGKPGQMVRRYVFQTLMAQGLRRSDRVASLCERLLCVSPKCLIARTPSEVLSISYENGRGSNVGPTAYRKLVHRLVDRGWTKLSWQLVHEMRTQADAVSFAELGRRHGVRAATIANAMHGRTWRHPQSSVFAVRVPLKEAV